MLNGQDVSRDVGTYVSTLLGSPLVLYEVALVSAEYIADKAERGNGTVNISDVAARWRTLRLSTGPPDIFGHIDAGRLRCEGRCQMGCETNAMAKCAQCQQGK